ncbi:MAG: hypothetical protein KDA68_13345, partial [Planctomycetaceae bacterium]|nr:hypothetical protein [Planctomycetaceae bacterium]
MIIDWLMPFRPVVVPHQSRVRRKSLQLVVPTQLEPRTLLSALPVGPEFRVNSQTNSDQFSTSIAMDADGDFVVVWQSFAQDGDGYGIYAQRYNGVGIPQGGEFPVNSYTTAFQTLPSVAMDDDGDFVVTWQSFDQDAGSWGIYAQRFNAAGTPQGSEFPVNSTTTGAQEFPNVAMDANGDFVITWTSFDGSGSGVYAQRYNSAGTPQGGEFQVNTHTTNSQNFSAVAMDAAGNFAITWQSVGQDGLINESGIFAQRYNSAGTPQGGEFQVNTFTADNQGDPAIAMNASGNFIIAWESHNQEGLGYGVYAQRYNALGTLQGGELHVNTYSTGDQLYPAVGMDADGDFTIAWQSFEQDGSSYG